MSKSFYFFSTLLLYFSLFVLNPNNKLMVLFFALYGFWLFKFNKSIEKSLLYTFLASWIINIGKTYLVQLLPAGTLPFNELGNGLVSGVVFSIKEILVILMALWLLREYLIGNKRALLMDRMSWLLFLYFGSIQLAAVFGSIYPELSLIHGMYELQPLIIYLFTRNVMRTEKRLLSESLQVLGASVIFQMCLSLVQFVNRNPAGLTMEVAQDFIRLDTSTEASALSFRPVGTFSHANVLAHYALLYLGIFGSFVFDLGRNRRYLTNFVVFGSAVVILLLSLSRSAWISGFGAVVIGLYLLEKRWGYKIRFNKIVRKWLFKFLIPVLILAMVFVLPRIANSFLSFERYGGATTRSELVTEFWKTFQENPWFGVGMGMDVYYQALKYKSNLVGNAQILFKNFPWHVFYKTNASPESVILYFPYSVHNGYLRLVAQTGLVPILIFGVISWKLFRALWMKLVVTKSTGNRIILTGLLVGLMGLCLNSFLQPLFPNLREVVYLSMIYLDKKGLANLA